MLSFVIYESKLNISGLLVGQNKQTEDITVDSEKMFKNSEKVPFTFSQTKQSRNQSTD